MTLLRKKNTNEMVTIDNINYGEEVMVKVFGKYISCRVVRIVVNGQEKDLNLMQPPDGGSGGGDSTPSGV